MLYLAQVQKKTKFLSATKTELKLLACQPKENHWSAVSRETVMPSEEASHFNEGVLVLVDLAANKRVLHIQEAASSLVKILQNFSHALEKWETNSQQRESWEERLMYQTAAVNHREMEIRVRQQQLERQHQEIERAREEIRRLWQQLELEQKKLKGKSKEIPDIVCQ